MSQSSNEECCSEWLHRAHSVYLRQVEDSRLTTRTGVWWLSEDGIIQFESLALKHTFADADENVEAIMRLAAGARARVLVDLSETAGITRDARVRYAGADMQRTVWMQAFVVPSPFARTVANLFMAMGRPPWTTRLFGSVAEALVWLRTAEEEKRS